jgi:hypothetical protein
MRTQRSVSIMPKAWIAAAATVLLLAGGAAALWKTGKVEATSVGTASRSGGNDQPAAITLKFSELLDPGPRLKPSAKALSLNGQRVRLVGFMAQMELPPTGAFYLVPRPISLDESGGGTADLPLDSVMVLVPSEPGKVITHVSGALEGTGIFEVGNKTDAEGRTSNFRLRLDMNASQPTSRAK